MSGLPKSESPRKHYDIYAILEGSQELYFGAEKEVNINIVEKVRVWTPQGEMEKCYISPTKRRGVERRCLLWSDAGGQLLMDELDCGIPNTCCKDNCPICAVYGGMVAGSKTFIGRLTHSGGVAVAAQIALEKQRAMHPALIHKEGDTNPKQKEFSPMPFRKEYAQPGLLYPVSNHCISVTENEFTAVAYAFLMSLNRVGAGNPKGVAFARAVWNDLEGKTHQDEPLLVLDEYRVPLGDRPIISPTITHNSQAVETFIKLAKTCYEPATDDFKRFTGIDAHKRLQELALKFYQNHLKA
ncbi:MAG: hypothetical protein HQK57_06680 [Deltaproteobacteria bacterium]|nr:hypothetical protein [Deltaproteobacteria bacterium]